MAITARVDSEGRTGSPYVGTDQEVVVPWIIWTDSVLQEEADISAAGVLPARGDVLISNTYLSAAKCTMKREGKNPLIWRAQVTYKPNTSDQEKLKQPDPTLREAEFDWNAVAVTVPAIKTVESYTPPAESSSVPAGSAVCNSAGDLFDPPAEKTEYYWTTTITKSMWPIPVWLLDVAGCVNSQPYVLDGVPIAEGASRICGLRIGRKSKENGFLCRTIQFTIEHRRQRKPTTPGEDVPLPWILELEDMGYNERETPAGQSPYLKYGPNTDFERILSSDSRPVPSPVFLDGRGKQLDNPTPETIKRRCFKIYETCDFSLLPLT